MAQSPYDQLPSFMHKNENRGSNPSIQQPTWRERSMAPSIPEDLIEDMIEIETAQRGAPAPAGSLPSIHNVYADSHLSNRVRTR